MLRRRGYGGALTMLSADDATPCDRPNLSKAWRERRTLFGSEFYFSGPSAIAREAHAAAARLTSGEQVFRG